MFDAQENRAVNLETTTLRSVYFSPTRTTRAVVRAVAEGLGLRCAETDLTTPAERGDNLCRIEEEVLLIGVPVYEEKVPQLIRPSLLQIAGGNRPVVLVAVYGNIGFGMTLVDLREICEEVSLRPIAAAAFVGEHSFATAAAPLAAGRPDRIDLERAREFGARVRGLLNSGNGAASIEPPHIPGRLPLIARVLPEGSADIFTHPPLADPASCTGCGACARRCPSGAIDADSFAIDESVCLRCFACVRVCPPGSRRIRYRRKPIVTTFLRRKNRRRREPDVFLGSPRPA